QLLYAIGVGYGVMVLGMLGISYWPGPVAAWQTALVFDALLVILAGLVWRQRAGRMGQPSALRISHSTPLSRRWLLAGVLVLVLVGGFFRFTNLGYAEFLTDEARTVLRAAAVLQGHEDVLFIHRKGPVEILLPAVIDSLTGHLDEASARLPFAIASLTGLLAVFLLGWRLFNPLAGWIAAFLLAFDGYLIGFARFVQYQSVVFLTAILIVLIGYRLVQQPKALRRYAILAAILWATGLLAHYDAALTVVPVAFLVGALGWQHRVRWATLVRATLSAALVGGGLLAVFYMPFVLAPHFQATYRYLIDQRIGSADRHFPYNNLVDFWQRSIVYNSTYAVILLIGLALVALAFAYWRGWPRTVGAALTLLLVAGLAILSWRGGELKVVATDLTFVPFALALMFVWCAPRLKMETRLLWLWFGVPMVLALFFTAFPGTHVYLFFAPWALLVGALVAQGWHELRRRTGQSLAVWAGSLAGVAVSVVFGLYAYQYFIEHKVEVLRTWATNRPAGYWTPANFDATQIDRVYGFPLANGWKAIGMLYAQGKIQGDYETNQRDDLIPAWYVRGQTRCASTANWYFAIDNLEPWSISSEQIKDALLEDGYKKWGSVKVNGASKLVIYQRTSEKIKQQTLRLEDYTAAFDARPWTDIPIRYPVIEDKIGHPLHINFDQKIWLEGYDLATPEPLKPGDTFRLTLYWRAQRPLDQSYKVFNQSFYGNGTMVAQKDSYPVCDRQLTSTWYPGELITDIYDIPVAVDAPAGLYPLYTGLYLEETQARLPVLDARGKPVDQQAHVLDLSIGAK
ncbi:MAG: glycosyltransferase family 39 protein, partial [Chloroflexi bacterium]|nr:glycosyltransferase family 39 protein [Chloroflexota bacterium]